MFTKDISFSKIFVVHVLEKEFVENNLVQKCAFRVCNNHCLASHIHGHLANWACLAYIQILDLFSPSPSPKSNCNGIDHIRFCQCLRHTTAPTLTDCFTLGGANDANE